MSEITPLVLASSSPRRRELLALGGWMFSVEISHIDEALRPGEEAAAYVRRLAEEKASAIQNRVHPGQVIVGADTSVVIDGDILGKPASPAEAREMLFRLRGRKHQVLTGVAVLRAEPNLPATILSKVVTTEVPMREYDEEEGRRYILSGDPMDKAGAYGIQNPDFQPVADMQGCYASVMGLPLCALSVLLRRVGVAPRAHVAGACQSHLLYSCPVSQHYLRDTV